MRLTNTLSGAVEDLEPLAPGGIGIYVCGVTPYDQSHIGHAMSAIVYDVLVCYLRWRGLTVTYVANYTDVDDKLIERGRELGRDPLELAQDNIEQWEREQEKLNLREPNERPRVTQEIDAITALVERIIENGHAYATAEGNVYFRVRSKADYGKLSHRDIEQLLSGTRVEPGEDKEFALDFALWKAAKPGEPKWPSPWGDGRPGWHIECSAMSQRYLGEAFDIHGGGLDLVFPHHENEIAQSEAAAEPGGQTFARLWMHNGLVQHDGEKMSKSIGNVITVEEALERWGADAIRLFALTGHYRSAANITDEAMAAAEAGVERLRNALRQAPATKDLDLAVVQKQRFVRAMEDDLNTPQALAALFDLARVLNSGRDAGNDIRRMQATLRELATEVLGLRLEEADVAELNAAGLSKIAARFKVSCGGTDVESTIEALLAHREQARERRDFALADGIREALAESDVEVEDTPDGPRWGVRR